MARVKKLAPHLAVICILLLLLTTASACITSDDGDDDASPEAGITATANISRAQTSTAEARAQSPTAAATATAEPISTAAAPTPTQIVLATPTQGDGATATEGTGGEDTEVQQQLAQILEDTAAIRELEPKEEIPAEIISSDQLHENLLVITEEDYPRAEAEVDSLGFWLLRLLDERGIDLYQLQIDLLSEQVLGYYDPDTRELYIVDDEGLSGLAQYTASHEFVHALQGQYFDLTILEDLNTVDSDRFIGALSLIEGDATLASTQYLFANMDMAAINEIISSAGDSTAVLDRAPDYIARQLAFPYEKGLEFVTQLYFSGGNASIDDALADPPVSSEQIMHPEKYTGERDEPQPVTLPDLTVTLTGWTLADEDTLGEFDLSVMLDVNGASEAAEGAAGWDGGRYALYTNGDDAAVIFTSIWDSEADATEFVEQLNASIPGGLNADAPAEDDGRFILVQQSSDTVTYVAATTAEAAEAAMP